MTASSWWRGAFPSDAEVRAEIWNLGTRHLGMPLKGALQELETEGLTRAQAQLLRACVRELKRQ